MQSARSVQTDVAVIGRLIKPDRGDFSPVAARELLSLQFDEDDKERMHQLSLKAQDGTLTPDEHGEIESYRRAGYLLGVLWSKARLSLKRAGMDVDHGRRT